MRVMHIKFLLRSLLSKAPEIVLAKILISNTIIDIRLTPVTHTVTQQGLFSDYM